jgi:hypothetical protein
MRVMNMSSQDHQAISIHFKLFDYSLNAIKCKTGIMTFILRTFPKLPTLYPECHLIVLPSLDTSTHLCTLTTKLCSPLGVVLKILSTDCRSRSLDSLDEIFDHKWGLQELLRLNIHPSHLSRPLVTR